jgi:hypothetical protein
MNEHTASATIGRRVLLGATSALLAAWPVPLPAAMNILFTTRLLARTLAGRALAAAARVRNEYCLRKLIMLRFKPA